jgi:CobQ-like glutamine amidotransferase family enzyme
MNWVFILMCWVMGIWGDEEGTVDRMRARARCRQIRVQRSEVVVKFTCEEDAQLFAEDLKNFTRE